MLGIVVAGFFQEFLGAFLVHDVPGLFVFVLNEIDIEVGGRGLQRFVFQSEFYLNKSVLL